MKYLLTSLAVLYWTYTWAGDTLSLKKCISIAIENNADIKSATFDLDQNTWKIKEIRSAGLPQINAGAEYQYYTELPTSMLPGEMFGQPAGSSIPVQLGQPQNGTLSASVSQLLYSQSFLTALKASKSSQELYQLLSQRTTEEVILDLSVQYYQTLNTENHLKTIQQDEAYLLKLHNDLTLLVAQDFATQTDLNRIKVNLGNLQTQRSILESKVAQQKMFLSVLIGFPVDSSIELQDEPLSATLNLPAPAEFDGQNLLPMKVLQQQKQLVQLEKKAIKGEALPNLSAFYSYQYKAQVPEFGDLSSGDNWNSTSLVGLKLSVPVFDGMNRKSRVQQQHIELHKIDNQLAHTNSQLNVAWQAATLEQNAAEISLENQKQNSLLAEEIYQNSNLSYQQGLIPLSDLLNAELAWKEAKQLEHEQAFNFQIAQLKLMNASGNILQLAE